MYSSSVRACVLAARGFHVDREDGFFYGGNYLGSRFWFKNEKGKEASPPFLLLICWIYDLLIVVAVKGDVKGDVGSKTI